MARGPDDHRSRPEACDRARPPRGAGRPSRAESAKVPAQDPGPLVDLDKSSYWPPRKPGALKPASLLGRERLDSEPRVANDEAVWAGGRSLSRQDPC